MLNRLLSCFRWGALLLFVAMLSSCMVGPDFHSPNEPNIKHYTPAPFPKKTVSTPGSKGGTAQTFVLDEELPANWWTLFHSPQLNDLIQTGLAHSPNMAAAKAALIQAQENLTAQIGSSLFPAFSANVTGTRERIPPAGESSGSTGGGGATIFNLFDAGVNVSYTLDVFGGLRRGIEAEAALVDLAKFQLDAAFLTLTSNIVTTAITTASLRAQIKATKALLHDDEESLKILKEQYALGAIPLTSVLTQQSEVATTRASLSPLEQNLAQQLHALSVLIGEFPSEDRLPVFNLYQLHLPTRLPISMPSALVRQRPDIRAAEATLHNTSAQIGVATANLYPQVTITGNYGWENTVLSSLINPNNKAWAIGPAVTESIFNGGALIAKKNAAIAAYQQAAAQYKETVLQGFKNVADTLRALQNDAKALNAEREAEVAAKNALTLTQKQYQLGGANYIDLLIAERTYQQTTILRIQAQALRYTDTAALFQALGGAWWRRPCLECDIVLTRNTEQYTPGNFNKTGS